MNEGFGRRLKGRISVWAGLLGCLALSALFRSQALRDDRTWYDEDYVIAGSLGLSLQTEFPRVFRHSEVYEPSLARCLTYLSQADAYPPLQYLVVYAAKNTDHPILTVRLGYGLLALSVPLVVFVMTRSVAPETAALFAAALVALSPAQALSSQQVKWYALAALAASLSAAFLFAASRSNGPLLWCSYAFANILLLHTHYFGLWVLPAHVLWVAVAGRARWGRFVLCWLGTALVCAPWYLLGLPRQVDRVREFFQSLPVSEGHHWARPLSLANLALWHGYNWLTALGAQPSPVRSRVFLPLLAVAFWILWKACRSHEHERRDLALLGTISFCVALAAQTLYAARLGHTTPLTWPYLAHWMPLLSLAVAIGLFEVSLSLRMSFGVALLILNLFNLSHQYFSEKIQTAGSLSNYRDVTAFLEHHIDDRTALAYIGERDAKKLNLFWRGEGIQLVGWPSESASGLAGIDRMIWITPVADSIPAPPSGAWLPPRRLSTMGWTAVSVSCRPSRRNCD